MMRRFTQSCVALGLSLAPLLSLTPVAQATLVKAYSLPLLSQDADQVVRVRVVALTQTPSDKPYTQVELRILHNYLAPQLLTGSEADTLTVTLPGGPTPHGLWLAIPGMPQFKIGEELVLFLEANRSGQLSPLGLGQGIYRVYRTGQGGFVVRQSQSELRTWHEETGQETPLKQSEIMRLEVFEGQLQEALKARSQRGPL